jgi:hypothetical protein
MDKAKLHHYWAKFRSPLLFLPIIGLVIFGTLFIYGMRYNNVTMLELKQKVIVADEQDGDIEGALQELRAFVSTHMNTNMRNSGSLEPPVQLVNEYNRDVAEIKAKNISQDNANKVYQEAQARCETGAIPLTARAKCIQDYVSNNSTPIAELQLPPKELYIFDFASPKWSPDLAGISMILSIFFGLLIIIRLLLGRYINYKLK